MEHALRDHGLKESGITTEFKEKVRSLIRTEQVQSLKPSIMEYYLSSQEIHGTLTYAGYSALSKRDACR